MYVCACLDFAVGILLCLCGWLWLESASFSDGLRLLFCGGLSFAQCFVASFAYLLGLRSENVTISLWMSAVFGVVFVLFFFFCGHLTYFRGFLYYGFLFSSVVLVGFCWLTVVRDLTVARGVLMLLLTLFIWLSRVTANLTKWLPVVGLFCLLLVCCFPLLPFNCAVLNIAKLMPAFGFSISCFSAIKALYVRSPGLSFYIGIMLRGLSWAVRLVHWPLVNQLWLCCLGRLVILLSLVWKRFFSSGEASSFLLFMRSCWRLMGSFPKRKLQMKIAALS